MNCGRCKHFKLYDDLFGYCRKYDEQALINQNCKKIKAISDDIKRKKGLP